MRNISSGVRLLTVRAPGEVMEFDEPQVLLSRDSSFKKVGRSLLARMLFNPANTTVPTLDG